MNQTIDHREGARRQNRSIALFCSLKCRHFDWDGIFIRGDELAGMLGLDRFLPSRLEWIKEDFAEHFPFQWVESSDSSSLTKLILCLRPMQAGYDMRIGYLSFSADPWSVRNEIRRTCLAPFAREYRNGSELAITSLLTMLAHGQICLRDIFGTEQGSLTKCEMVDDVRNGNANHMISRFPMKV